MPIATDFSVLFKVPLVVQVFTEETQWSWQESHSSSPSQRSKKNQTNKQKEKPNPKNPPKQNPPKNSPAVLKDTALLDNWDNELTRTDFSLPLFSRIVSNKICQAEKPLLRGERQRGRAEIHRVSLKRQSFAFTQYAHSCSL